MKSILFENWQDLLRLLVINLNIENDNYKELIV